MAASSLVIQGCPHYSQVDIGKKFVLFLEWFQVARGQCADRDAMLEMLKNLDYSEARIRWTTWVLSLP